MALIKMNFISKKLGMQTNVTICLPTFSFADIMNNNNDVYIPGMKYQVLWLLHGGSGDDSDYVNFSNIVRYSDQYKLAVVMPADYNMNYDDYDNGAKYQTYIAEELPNVLRSIFPFSDKREDNFIGGLSMGAAGCEKIAIRYPENYAAALVMSGGTFYEEENHTRLNTGMPMPIHRPEACNENKIIAIKNIQERKKTPKFFTTCGDKDVVLKAHQESSKFLKEIGYDVFEEIVCGYGHEWDFWDITLRKAFEKWLPIQHRIIYP